MEICYSSHRKLMHGFFGKMCVFLTQVLSLPFLPYSCLECGAVKAI